MIDLSRPSCGAVVQVDSPGFDPCDSCQAIRALAEHPQCDLAPAFVEPPETFEQWLVRTRGCRATTATGYGRMVENLRARKIETPDQFPSDFSDGTKRTYGTALLHWHAYREAIA